MTTAILCAPRSPERASTGAPPIVSRADHDFYPTPPEAVHALLSVESFDGPIWEPACGDGAIAKELIRHGHDVRGTDLIDRGYGTGGVDFLNDLAVFKAWYHCLPPKRLNIITNPPYSYRRGIGDKFVGQSLRITRVSGGKVAMLLNLGSLCHPTRHAKWRNNPPAAIHALDELVCWPNGDRRQAGRYIAEHRYCWIVWDPKHTGPTKFGWLRTADFRHDGGRA